MHRHLLVVVAGAALALGARSIVAQNLLTNPGFDQDLAGWTSLASSYNPQWSSTDASGSAHSGSVRAFVPGGVQQGGRVVTQCIPVAAGASYDFSFKARVQQLDYQVGYLVFVAESDCLGVPLSGYSIHLREGQPNAWVSVHQLATAPAGAQRALVELYATTLFDAGAGAAHTVFFDDVYFGPPAPTSCTAGAKTLCVDRDPGDARFRIRTTYATVQSGGLSGEGNAISLSSLGVDRGGLFWFFAADNPEVLVKVLDACSVKGYFWVFISAGTNVGVNVFIGDTVTGAVVLFHNPDLGAFPPIQNIYAIPCD